MSVIYMLIAISTFVAGTFFYFFIKAVRSGQYEDVETPAIRMLFDDEIVDVNNDNKEKTQEIKLNK